MTTAKSEITPGAFAVWLTGLPASGKSAITAELTRMLRDRGIEATVLESDALRAIWAERPQYDEPDRENFYRAVGFIAQTLTQRGVPVIIDATANRRAYRDRARKNIPRFVEVFVACPLEVCMRRDPKGLYRHALQEPDSQLPGIGVAYEPPECPDVIAHTDYEHPEAVARRIVAVLTDRGFLPLPDSVAPNPANGGIA